MLLKLGIAFFAVCLLLTSCSEIDNLITGGNQGKPQPAHMECEPVGAVDVTDLACIRMISHPFRFSGGAVVDGDKLCMGVNYSGGCAEHKFDAYVYTHAIRENPLRVVVILNHYNNDDPCDTFITRKIGFDLTSLKEHLQKLTGQPSGTVLLDVSGYDELQTVVYTY